ncbi:hypothetical protein [Campylobacter lari]|uniref:hypothetical protein n=1 Tax=Campylobacter lari TaxID=201 RepID=UPI0021538A9E|nr:hypothetical protein [Campylobacter lari]MCR6547729.1 hypothetical protein [Campylobacter lari]MCR6549552.1 hypothetical protein [Campylobacter lari]
MKKKLAVQFFGHLRTYEKTYEKFFENIIRPNTPDWDIDIFIHTWNKLSSSDGSWHKDKKLFDERELMPSDIETVKNIYKPKMLNIEVLTNGKHGGALSKKRGNEIREEYQLRNNISYDYILYTRPDVLFVSPLKINKYLNEYIKYPFLSLERKHVFCGNNFFRRMSIADPRYVNEGDIVYISSHSQDCYKPEDNKDFIVIPIDYALYKDFFLQRNNFIHGWNTHPLIKMNNLLLEQKQIIFQLKTQYKLIEKEKLDSENIIDNINKNVKKLESKIKSDEKVIKELEEKNIKNIFNNLKKSVFDDKNFIYIDKSYSGKEQIRNHLSYKLGILMLNNCKGVKNFFLLPFYLIATAKLHKPLKKTFPIYLSLDYDEAMKIKDTYAYKLGEQIICMGKTWHKLGYFKLWFNARRFKRKKDV